MEDSVETGRTGCCSGRNRVERRGPGDRGKIYSHLAGLYQSPSWDLLQNGLDRLIVESSTAFVHGEPRLKLAEKLDSLERDIYCQGLETFQDEFVRLFVNSPEGVAAPPFASFYSETRLQGEAARTALAHYERFQLTPSAENGEVPDHIVNELEFLSILCAMEDEAEKEGLEPEARALRRAQADFLLDHFIEWAAPFCDRLVQGSRLAFYQLLGIFTKGFLAQEREHLERVPKT